MPKPRKGFPDAQRPKSGHGTFKNPNANPNPNNKRKPLSSSSKVTKPKPKPKSQNQNQNQNHQQKQHQEPTTPFNPTDAILLIGEGDLSFAASLVEHHACVNVTATVLEKNLDELTEKYPHAAANVDKVQAEKGCKVLYNVDARTMKPFVKKQPKVKASNLAIPGQGGYSFGGGDRGDRARNSAGTGLMDRVMFNFPHVGGKSTDVNRQVRYNQEMLVDFFTRAVASLAPHGTIVVTLFEGEPYTLWNIRDLARHSGLQVDTSFRFQAAAYPGYHHSRTLGVVKNKAGEATATGWKGEERAARSYIFVRKGETPKPVGEVVEKKKKKKSEDDDDDDDDSSGDDG